MHLFCFHQRNLNNSLRIIAFMILFYHVLNFTSNLRMLVLVPSCIQFGYIQFSLYTRPAPRPSNRTQQHITAFGCSGDQLGLVSATTTATKFRRAYQYSVHKKTHPQHGIAFDVLCQYALVHRVENSCTWNACMHSYILDACHR